MKYFDDMQDKYGFVSGEQVPVEAPEARDVYIRFLNVLLAIYDSKCRLLPYSRPGVHNWCMVLRVSEEFFEEYEQLSEADAHYMVSNFQGEQAEIDEGWHKAIETANSSNLDECVIVEVVIDECELGRKIDDAVKDAM